MELLKEVIQVYMERKEWFWELILQHITISAIAILLCRCYRPFDRNVDRGA